MSSLVNHLIAESRNRGLDMTQNSSDSQEKVESGNEAQPLKQWVFKAENNLRINLVYSV
ncbi:hypothetical protein BofuT4_uP152120.1 [Botrytis cinerea T4]|uniref:Uncharacterized protein n=1 Tax=Botryotinia fuckeliana (strain T4) TaxID=999810 RepID=G2YWT2_BOTF4|nr:hypothetical protein BofuT4_uP152120.1 [Botrytis cinerea T4]